MLACQLRLKYFIVTFPISIILFLFFLSFCVSKMSILTFNFLIHLYDLFMHLFLGYTQMKFYLVLHLNDNFWARIYSKFNFWNYYYWFGLSSRGPFGIDTISPHPSTFLVFQKSCHTYKNQITHMDQVTRVI